MAILAYLVRTLKAAMPLYAIAAAHVFDRVKRSEIVETSSRLLLPNGVGAVAGPLVASALMRLGGPPGLFVATGGAHLALTVFVIWRITRRAPVPVDRHSEFDVTTTAPTMAAR